MSGCAFSSTQIMASHLEGSRKCSNTVQLDWIWVWTTLSIDTEQMYSGHQGSGALPYALLVRQRSRLLTWYCNMLSTSQVLPHDAP